MRYVDIASLDNKLSQRWKHAAQRARDEIAVMPNGHCRDIARAVAINKKSHIWGSAKKVLRTLFNEKCWYCESFSTRADMAVDHYRPKNEVKECTDQEIDHPGYWWLAFEPSNFRFSCQYCNEIRRDDETGLNGGKSSSFPVRDENNRLYRPGNYRLEGARLLDPIVRADTYLLDFEATGKQDVQAIPKYKIGNPRHNEWHNRAEESIRLYHLNKSDLKRRRLKVWERAEELAKRIIEDFDLYCNGDDSVQASMDNYLKDLMDLMSKDAEYSATAIASARRYKSCEMIEQLLNDPN